MPVSRNRLCALTSLPFALALSAALLGAASSQQPQPQQGPAEPPKETTTTVQLPPPTSLVESLLLEIETLKMELTRTRAEMARARLDATTAQRELDELRQFVADHERFGDDFQQYQVVKAAADREARDRENEQSRARKAEEKAEQAAKRQAARSAAAARNADANRIAEYRRNGFTALGLDVFGGKMAFFYNTKDTGSGVQYDYDSLIGDYLRPGFPNSEIDYSKMTISGSILNASDVVRNIGVAITFFDDNGNQVGHETVEIRNARPDVPYPFTSKIEMALNRPFESSSTYVLYADPVEE